MHITIHKEKDRGGGEHGWLSTKHSFSFASWYNPTRMGFGSLRVLNDDIIMPGSGFGMHAHDNMEIITIVTKGTVSHEDNVGNMCDVTAGEVQVMSAGTGVTHAESNQSDDEVLKLYQIWIEPREQHLNPSYAQKDFSRATPNQLTCIVSPNGAAGSLKINQDAYIYKGAYNDQTELPYRLKHPGNGIYMFIIKGEARIGKETLVAGDAAEVTDVDILQADIHADTELLLFEV